MNQKELFSSISDEIVKQRIANASLADALNQSMNGQVVFDYDIQTGEWGSTGSTEPENPLVDLGLSVKWAKHNVGATHGNTPESWYGGYYAWGEIEEKSNYDWSTYKFGPTTALTKYNNTDNKRILDPEDDVATVVQGLRIPTYNECHNLLANTTASWVRNYNGITGLNGVILTSKINGNTLFIPNGGSFSGTNKTYAGSIFQLICSTRQTGEYSFLTYSITGIINIQITVSDTSRAGGYNIRGVQ